MSATSQLHACLHPALQEDESELMEEPKVSTIVPTYNSAATLADCLKSIRNQNYSRIEIVVVDSGSSDGTVAIAAQYKARIIQQKSTAALARNVGIANSTGKYVFFVDSDQVLSISVVAECVKNCEDGNAVMLRVPEVFVGEGFWGSCSAEWKNSYEKVEQEYGATREILTGEPRFYVKEQIVRAGMYNDNLVWGEDYDLYRRMRKMDAKEASCMSKLYHYEPARLSEILFKLFRYGNSIPVYTRSTGQRVLRPMISHSLLTLKDLLKRHREYPAIVAGCAVLFCLKTCFMAFGLVRGSLTQ